ncbi:conjugal transfer protein TraF [Marinomonas colpomeniae]|uniref:Conjugal transfer protein TraF n=1 Tax=Marinomonas colpomeniae TaxID=2774408 RepID=A0ABR8P273_9GAMM|nr:conjugal transfer protein TraF [Marinomonas colpomeniae]MBD5772361.1 conjugal transfer protein TraF [Marinomonas colpomeniae]
MRKYLIIIFFGVFSSFAMASMYPYQPIGSSIVLGGYGNRHALSTASGNPASSYLMANLEGFRTGFLGPVGIALEGGGVNGINDKIDDLTEALDASFLENFETTLQNAQSNSSSFSDADAVDAAETLLTDFDAVLSDVDGIVTDISNTLYAKVAVTTQAPFLPIIYKTRRRGVFTFDAGASLVGRVNVLADNLTYTGLDDIENVSTVSDLTSADISSADVETETSVYIKRASDYRFSFGYSEMVSRTETNALILGGRINFHQLALGQKLTVITEDDDSSVSYGDFFSSRSSVSSGISLDIGAILVARDYQLGISMANVNEPTFDYDALGNCSGLSGADLSSCNAAVSFADAGVISLNEEYKMRSQITIDGAIKSKDQNFSLAGSYDLNAIKDPLGDEYQWSVVSLSVFSDYLLVPGFRVGIRKNMVGTELSYLTVGTTFFRRLDVDLAYAAENDDGNSGAFLSVGYSLVF